MYPSVEAGNPRLERFSFPFQFLLHILRYCDQPETPEQAEAVTHAPDVCQLFGPDKHNTFHLGCLLKCHPHGAPRQEFAVFPAVDEKFFGVFAVSPNLQCVGKWKAGNGTEGIMLECDNTVPQMLFCWHCRKYLHSGLPQLIISDPLRILADLGHLIDHFRVW